MFECPGARAVKNSSGYFSRTGSESYTSREQAPAHTQTATQTHAAPLRPPSSSSPNRRPHHRNQILRPRPIPQPHRPNPPLDNPLQRPPPSRMERRHRPPPHIRHQHRNAVRHLHPQHHARHIRHHPIAAQHRAPLRRLQPALQRAIARAPPPGSTRNGTAAASPAWPAPRPATSLQKPPPVLRHIRRLILLGPSQIQRTLAINRRHPARPRAEPMPQPAISLPTRRPHHPGLAARDAAASLRAPASADFVPPPLATLPGPRQRLPPPMLQPHRRQQLIHLPNRLCALYPAP